MLGARDHVTRLETDYGGSTGERWGYYRDGKTIEVIVDDEKIVRIQEKR